MYRIVVGLLISAIFCGEAFGFGVNLYPIRLILPLALVYSLFVFAQVIFVERKEIKITFLLGLCLSYFAYKFLHTFFISYIHVQFHNFEYPIADLGNYAVLSLLIITLFILALLDVNRFYKIAVSITSVFYVSYLLFALIEVKTGFHLPVSNLIEAPAWRLNIPSVVFHNANDFAAVFTMMFVFLFSQLSEKKTLTYQFFLMLILVIHLYVLYLVGSRLSMLLFVLFIMYKYPKKLVLLSGFSGILFFSLGYLGETAWFMQSMDSVDKLVSDLSFGERGSTMVRLHLYKHALLSAQEYWGMGHGINASLEYYRTVTDPNLHYITNPHSHLFEMLINSGVIVTLFYIILNGYILVKNWSLKNYDLIVQLIIYNLLLFSSSSSLFLWSSYLLFLLYVLQTVIKTRRLLI